MFQLIVAVISIALVAALAIASIYYGGSAFSSSSLRANVVTLVNGGQQIAGAQALYKTDFGVTAKSTDALIGGGYLSAVPGVSTIAKGSAWAVEPTNGNLATVTLVDTSACAEVVKQANGTQATGAQFYCDGTTFTFKL